MKAKNRRTQTPFPAALLVALLAAVACSDAPPEPASDGLPEDAVEVPFEDIAGTPNSGFSESARMVIENNGALGDFWATLEAPVSPKSEPPEVNFDRSTVIAAAIGERATGGYSVTIDAVRELHGTIYVKVTTLSPGPGCMTTQALTQPVSAVRADVLGDRVEFVEVEETSNCE